jgi:hypothetical protein
MRCIQALQPTAGQIGFLEFIARSAPAAELGRSAIWETVVSPRQFVARLFPEVEHVLLTGLVARVTRLELTDVGAVVNLNLNRQAAIGVKSGALESVKRTKGVWQAFWRSPPGTVFNTDGLRRKLKGSCMCRVAKPTTLLLLLADDFEAELNVNGPLSEALGVRDE